MISDALKTLEEMQQTRRIIKKPNLNQSFELAITVEGRIGPFLGTALVDSGCTESFIDRRFAQRLGIPIRRRLVPIPVEGSHGKIIDKVDGSITVQLTCSTHLPTQL